ncbi:MAG: phytanoyl-CoA dioxygenase family protein [Saprospiraceae bacterium]|nr:phytanoyl-CoA dioxygenase family protein [Saprospiraceae bacterium]
MLHSRSTYTISDQHKSFYQKNGFIKLKEVFNKEEVAEYNRIISKCVMKMKKEDTPLEERDTYGRAFLQLFNLWTEDEEVKSLVFNQKLAQIATELMGAKGVRMYHDQALFKEAGGGITPWHADQYYWPLSSDKTITAWIPLQETPLEMGPLEFSAASQHLISGRNLSISDQSEEEIGAKVRLNNFQHVIEPFEAGEVSFHCGWVFHRAGSNRTNQTRKVMTIIYMDENMRLKTPENSGQQNDWETWCPGAKVGEVIDSHLNPILYGEKPDRYIPTLSK